MADRDAGASGGTTAVVHGGEQVHFVLHCPFLCSILRACALDMPPGVDAVLGPPWPAWGMG